MEGGVGMRRGEGDPENSPDLVINIT